MKKRNFNKNLLIFSLILIPILTISFGLKKSPFDFTLSMIGNWFGLEHRLRFIAWGIITGISLAIFITNLFRKANFKEKKAFRYLYASTIFLILTVITPTITKEFVPKELRVPHFDMHLVYGIFFALTLILALYSFSKYLTKTQKDFSFRAMRGLIYTVAIPFIALILFGMTGIFEIAFFIGITIFLWLIDQELEIKMKGKKLFQKSR